MTPAASTSRRAPEPAGRPGVLITGSTGVLGRAFASVFAEAGYFIAAHFRSSRAKAEDLLAELGCEGAVFEADLTRIEATQEAARGFFREHPNVEVLINNAGSHKDQLFALIEPDGWRSILDANLTSLYPVTHPFLRSRIARRSGSVINITSFSAFRSIAGQTSYSAAKAGVLGFTRVLAREVGRYGIRVNAIAPGAVESPAISELPPERQKEMAELASLNRIAQPEEVATVARFLASPDASFITGQTLPVDGGLL